MNLNYPADMASHWALFQAGGVGNTASALPCHRCLVTYGELGVVFDVYKVQPGDTVNSIAAAHGIFPEELRVINPESKTNEAKLKKHHSKSQQKFTPTISRHLPKDADEVLKTGSLIRVHKVWKMDRECPEKFLNIPHIKAPLCFLHAGMRVTEWLLLKLQERAVQQKHVMQLNRAWKESGAQYQMNPDKSGQGTYYKPSCDGRKTKAVIHSSSDWMHAVDSRGPILNLWKQWERIFEIGRKMEPTAKEKQDFEPLCRQFFRCCRMLYTDEGLSWYVHHLAQHGGEYIRRRALGKDMNEALEAHHQTSWQMAGHVFHGLKPGNPYCVKCEDGTFDKSSGPVYDREKVTITESVMQTQYRLFFDKFKKDWDPSVWTSVNLPVPESNQSFVQQYREHSPIPDLTVQQQGLRRVSRIAEAEIDRLNKMKADRSIGQDTEQIRTQEKRVERVKKSVNTQKRKVDQLRSKAAVASALKRARNN
ncbi:hypothetical protein CYMTET_11327 [Cymbomonas tetramitiformis]|uniref:LysM domain-containing protein n=1 Tax=Cymbomonas tetramitiformis TaxID=36881 RepID=A0AAE0GMJ5_9CHLO|nr:hypothetical protein CYMTET_31723 [Cymbomonas tetramitiformis]KAK3280856.1 hypothetical protein CYMTET_11327 [Cymbomonas tetramitiformis]